MNFEKAKLHAYLFSLCLFMLCVVGSLFDQRHLLRWMGAAFVFLGFAWLAERCFSRRRKIPGSKKVVDDIGQIHIDGTLRITDQLSLKETQLLEDIPEGEYSVQVETWADGADVYVSGLTVTGSSEWRFPRNQTLKVNVDTGFLILTGASKSKELQQSLNEAQSNILSDAEREVDVVLFGVGGKNMGVVSSTGFGDDQYSVTLRPTGQNSAQIVCSFIENK